LSRIARPRVAIGLLLAVALATRLPAYLGGFHGEQDAARLVVDALVWIRAGVRSEALSEYRYYTSSGYIALVAWIAQSPGGLTDLQIAKTIGSLNLALAVLIVVPAYWFAIRLTDSSTALIAGLVMLFMPMMWHAGSYGFPHLPAVFCLLCAYFLYDRHLTGPQWLGTRADVLVVFALLIACALFKADAFLGAVGLPALLVLRQKVTSGRLLFVAALLVIPPLAAAAAAHGLLQAGPTVASYMRGYERQYPTTLWLAWSPGHVEGLMMAFGFLTLPIFAIGLLVALATRRWPVALLLVAWTAAPMAFWFFRPGDSARHHLPEAFPVALGVAMALLTMARAWWLPYSGLALLLAVNYTRYWPADDSFRPSGRVIESTRLIRARVAEYHRLAAEYAAIDKPRKVLLGTITNPYVDSEVLLKSERVLGVVRAPLLGFDAIQIVGGSGAGEFFSASVRVNVEEASAAAQLFRAQGYEPYSIEYNLKTGQRASSWRLWTLEAE
jgi:hypothetical protein